MRCSRTGGCRGAGPGAARWTSRSDGSLLVSDDMTGRIYRISYEVKSGASGPGKDGRDG